MHAVRHNKRLADIINEGALLQQQHGRYEAALFLRAHQVGLRLLLRVLAPLPRRRLPVQFPFRPKSAPPLPSS